MSNTDFDAWLDAVDIDGHEQIMALYLAVTNEVENDNIFSCERTPTGWVVSASHTPEKLFLASDKAKNYFITFIENRFCDGMDVESYYGFHYAINNDKS